MLSFLVFLIATFGTALVCQLLIWILGYKEEDDK
jgi:hypothetical protein